MALEIPESSVVARSLELMEQNLGSSAVHSLGSLVACPGELHAEERRRLPEVHTAMEEPIAGTAGQLEPTSCWGRWDRGARRGPARGTECNPLL
jgi:hypothetical protein